MKTTNLTTAVAASPQLVRIALWCAYASGVVSVFGIASLIAFFTLGGAFGTLNDVAVIIQYLMMLPIALLLWQLLSPKAPSLTSAGLALGMAGMLAVTILQGLLVANVLPFSRQIVLVVPAFLVVLAWFVINGSVDRSARWVPRNMLLNVLAGLYVAYPIWAFAVGRRLLVLSRTRP